jgi:GNAT superfamily N-acetyltransferase
VTVVAELEFFTEPAAFLDVAGPHLALDPVLNTVAATVTERMRDDEAEGLAIDGSYPRWWLAVREAGQLVGMAMRTANFPPHPLYLLPMPDDASRDLARALHARGEEAPGINGALPAAEVCAREMARLTGGEVVVSQHTRLFELGELVTPPQPPGRLRPAELGEPGDEEVALAWFVAFMGDADEQAGRARGSSHESVEDLPSIRRRIAQGRLWFWVDAAGERVHLTGANAPSYGVARIGPVYTAPDQRGRGYASAAVAEVSRRIVAGGARACLFTDQANPTSNRIYEALGYRPVVDMANLLVVS